MFQGIQRRLGGCQDFDIEAVEQRPRPEFGAAQAFVDVIEIQVGVCRSAARVQAEHLVEHMIQPDAGGRAGKQVVILCEKPPYFA